MELRFYFSANCPHCRAAARAAEAAIRSLGLAETIMYCSVTEYLESAVASGVRATPALTLDGQLVAIGRLRADELVIRLGRMLNGRPTS